MSRAATALAPAAPAGARHARTRYEPQGQRFDSAPFRLLGEGSDASEFDDFEDEDHLLLYVNPAVPGSYLPGGISQAYADSEAAISYQADPARSGRWTVRPGRHLVLGIAISLLALVIAVTPALASALSKGGQHVRLSGYTDRAVAPKAKVAGPQAEAPPAPKPANEAPQPASSQPTAPPAQVPSGKYEVAGPPSVSVQQIERVLAQYGSPAAGHGQTLYDLGVKYGINPAYALAFFVHESGCGTKGVARFTKSLGNIRWTAGFDNYEGYRSYRSWGEGMEDWYKLITDLYIGGWGLRTVDAIIPVYAPWGDNNHPPTYIASVKAMVDGWHGK